MTGPPTLATLWSQWTHIVSRVASGAAGSNIISDAKYERLYKNLLTACREQVDSNHPEQSKKLLSLVQPWVTLETLLKADVCIVLDLLVKSQIVEDRLTGRRRLGPGFVRRMRWLAVLVVLGIASFFLWKSSDRLLHWDLFTTTRAYSFKLVRFLRGTSFMERVGVLALGVIVVGTFLLKGMRKY
jgi:hypothetical protein